MWVDSLDHIVLTVADVETSAAFYVRVLGMERQLFGAGRVALHFGAQKLNLHPDTAPMAPHAARPTPGSADLCFVSARPLAEWRERLAAAEVAVELGPLARTGAQGPMQSLYFRDPDANLIEIAWYDA
jgi:catechol 2,3-dioxygenase-like lactoylglutathione lyase family enzyme